MRYMTSTEIRNMWFDFFKSKGHAVIESASLIPEDDDSLFFVNAGVTPLKKYFDGTVVPDNKRLTSIQKCIRTNDIENVGVTKRHQTLFEMMGNFSVGDYFREEALAFAFELLTSEDYFAIPKEKIYVTIYTDDDASFNRWVEVGLDPEHIVRLEGNFWEIGSGPCGPDSEIFFDRGDDYDPNGDALEKFKKDEDQERYVEIWNNVFSQFNSEPGKDRKDYKELPHKNIDTGAGLERWCCIFQGVDSNFDTDLFVPIIKEIENLSGTKYNGETPFKVIADHIRAITNALSDGCIFENSGRGYVLRRLLRRSVRLGRKIGLNEPFMYKLVDVVVEIMKDSYPKLVENKGEVKALILEEEKLFNKTLSAGEKKLYEFMEEAKESKTISGYDAFKLYDTYGFPFELTLEYLEEEGYTVDREEFDKYMEEAKKLAKDARKDDANMNIQNEALLNFTEKSVFDYGKFEMTSKVIGLFKDGEEVKELDSDGFVIFDKTCFYAESGGQVADIGGIKSKTMKAKVVDVIKAPNGQHLHKVEIMEGSIKVGDECDLKILESKRLKTRVNHSTTHIVQKMLQENLSTSIHQAGSYVDDERLRFDFVYTGKIHDEDIINIEEKVREFVKNNYPSHITEKSLEEAKEMGAMALFSDKYKDIVRVVQIGPSIELCGGTHIENTSEVEKFAILGVESKGSNLFRLEATTNDNVEKLIEKECSRYIDEIKNALKKAKDIIENAKKDNIKIEFDIQYEDVPFDSYKAIITYRNELEYVQSEVKKLEKTYNEKKSNVFSNNVEVFFKKKEVIDGRDIIIERVKNVDNSSLKDLVDNLANMIDEGCIFFLNTKDKTSNFLCKSTSPKIHAGMLMKKVAGAFGGNGGGSPTFAQGGSGDIGDYHDVIDFVHKEIDSIEE